MATERADANNVQIAVFEAVFDSGPGFMLYAVPTPFYRTEMTEEQAAAVSVSPPTPLAVPSDIFGD